MYCPRPAPQFFGLCNHSRPEDRLMNTMQNPRSTLHVLVPMGQGTADIESLSSYFCRLAKADYLATLCLKAQVNRASPTSLRLSRPRASAGYLKFILKCRFLSQIYFGIAAEFKGCPLQKRRMRLGGVVKACCGWCVRVIQMYCK